MTGYQPIRDQYLQYRSVRIINLPVDAVAALSLGAVLSPLRDNKGWDVGRPELVEPLALARAVRREMVLIT